MKKKLLSVIALAMTMTMTTSAFAAIAPRARGTGDVDGDGILTANDVVMILNGLANDHAEANVDGVGDVDILDARVAFKTVLQPKTVTENLVLNIYATEGLNGNINILDAAKLGAATDTHDDVRGINTVNVTTAENITGVSTIQDAIREAVAAATADGGQAVTNQINKIYFVNAVRGDVYLRSENGWAMFANALRYIVPLDQATADLCNKSYNANYDPATATAEQTARYEALMEVKKVIVGSGKIEGPIDPVVAATAKEDLIPAADLQAALEKFFEAVPPTITEEEINLTAQEVLKITDTKYDFTISYNDGEGELLKADTIVDSQFLKDFKAISQYDTKTVADYRNTFGDKVVFSAKNLKEGATPITAVLEVAEVAE